MQARSAFASSNDLSTNDFISDTDTAMANPAKPFSVRPSVSMNELIMDEFKLEPGAPEGAQSPRNESSEFLDASKKPSQRLLIRKYDSWSALDEGGGSVAQSPQSPRALMMMKRMAADEKPPRPTPAPALRPNSQLPPLAPQPDASLHQ
jgi:hypothetical protein